MIRWVCKCGKRWSSEVDTCIHCNGEITKQEGSKFTVVGITKVNVPSTTHPDVPYNVVLLKDEHDNISPKKTLKDFNIGDNFEDSDESNERKGFFARLFRRK